MCTVTFIPSGNTFLFTSSRDEHVSRQPALPPKIYEDHGFRYIYPKDPQGGGSWMALKDDGNIAILLNGAIKAHVPNPPYRKSRGVILLELISKSSPGDTFNETNFTGIEPFTVILFDNFVLWCGKWDGRMKWIEEISISKPHIWSSVTLYDPSAISLRENWFRTWYEQTPYPGTMDIFYFHQKGGDGDSFNDILMNRNQQIFTNSISSVRLSPDSADFRYLDMLSGESTENALKLRKKPILKS